MGEERLAEFVAALEADGLTRLYILVSTRASALRQHTKIYAVH